MKKKLVYLLSIVFLLSSCYPHKYLDYEDLDLVYTNYKESFKFKSIGTYSMPDKIVKVTGNIENGATPEFISEPYNSEILQQIEDNMNANGWTKVDNPSDADITLLPAAWTNTTVYYWDNYWCWYYPYYCGYGYPITAYASYSTGTLVMTMVDPNINGIDPEVVWTAIANGVLCGEYDFTRISDAIDRSFEQSPYLNVE